MDAESQRRLERGLEFEGYAFTFCKAAFLALVLQRYTLLATSLAATALYLAALRDGVREWRCFVKPPWVVAFFGAVATAETIRLARRNGGDRR